MKSLIDKVGDFRKIVEAQGLILTPFTYPTGLASEPVSYVKTKDGRTKSTIKWKREEGWLLECFPRSWNMIMKAGNEAGNEAYKKIKTE